MEVTSKDWKVDRATGEFVYVGNEFRDIDVHLIKEHFKQSMIKESENAIKEKRREDNKGRFNRRVLGETNCSDDGRSGEGFNVRRKESNESKGQTEEETVKRFVVHEGRKRILGGGETSWFGKPRSESDYKRKETRNQKRSRRNRY